MNKNDRFMAIEQWLLRLYTVIAAIGILTITILYFFETLLDTIASLFSWYFVVALYLLIGIFLVSIVQILRYLITTAKRQDRSIRNSLVIVFTSPISIILYWLITFLLLLSMASCS